MTSASGQKRYFQRTAGLRLRCFLKVALLLALVPGVCSASVSYAATCQTPEGLGVNRIRGAVYGPSGVSLAKIPVQLSQDGSLVGKMQTDDRGRFGFTTGPGVYDLHIQFLGTKSLSLKVRVGPGHGSFFHPARLWIVLGLSGARCDFATTSGREFKDEIKRLKGLLQEKRH